eukprot:GILI01013674.1.p1 GENE.GILI01013674.1~~GILI01013674.1.p1  ORF type:complete len:185 (-),score=42.20 GILI01013674.1:232-786(-)
MHQCILLVTCLLALFDSSLAQSYKTPIVKWAQKPDKLFMEIMVSEASNVVVNFTTTSVFFQGVSRGDNYRLNLQFLRPINSNSSSFQVSGKSVLLDMPKRTSEPCWKRLTRSKQKMSFLKVDFDRWDSTGCEGAKRKWKEDHQKPEEEATADAWEKARADIKKNAKKRGDKGKKEDGRRRRDDL